MVVMPRPPRAAGPLHPARRTNDLIVRNRVAAGIVTLFDSTGKRLWTKDFPVAGATLQPVNWDGSGVELMLWSFMPAMVAW